MLASFYRDVRSDYEAVERYLAKAIYMAEALPLSREFPISNIRWQRGRNLIQLGQLEDAQIEFELLLGQEGKPYSLQRNWKGSVFRVISMESLILKRSVLSLLRAILSSHL